MQIYDLRLTETASTIRASATVAWEDCNRTPLEIFFETDQAFRSGFVCEPNAFLIGCALPAMHYGERRIRIEAEICPVLKNNLTVAMNWHKNWFETHREIVRIEGHLRPIANHYPEPRNAALFFSGGIDSLSALRFNHLSVPNDHPWRIRDGIIIYGQNIESDNRPETFDRAVSALREVSDDAGIALLPIRTNLRELQPDTSFFMKQYHGAIMGAAAHALAGRISLVYIAASESIPSTLKVHNVQHFKPYGSHPLIDPLYGSTDLRIHTYGAELSRLDKTRLVSDWEIGLQNIKVCSRQWPGENCGRCEKCVRTMLALVAVNRLGQTRAFKEDDVSESLVRGVQITKQSSRNSYTIEETYLELIPELMGKGRQDLVRGIRHILARSRYKENSLLKDTVRHYDKKYLRGSLSKLKRVNRLKTKEPYS